ncbi:unnamed protein product [Ambrosiozyma monospora]|uniref:Unnamed protein product n=1 Tax=Ambrosiozyma monospora TaxID=43982 RepID=A0A9W6Z5I7_AMBMO|nr:unnamed protein product [Ambrosiozyma monospora]
MPLPDVPAPLNPDTADHLIKSFPQTVQFQLEVESDDTLLFDKRDVDVDPHTIKHPHLVVNDLDPDCEYDNLILNLGKLNVFVSPEVAPVVVKILEDMQNFSVENILDVLEMDVFDYLLKVEKSTSLKLKFDCPLLSLKVAQYLTSTDCIDIDILSPSVAFSLVKFRNEPEKVNASVKAAQFDIELLHDSSRVALVILYQLSLLMSQESGISLNYNQQDLSIFVDPHIVTWIGGFADTMMKPISDSLKSMDKVKGNKQKAKAEALYLISTSGTKHGIRHDPSCITKPTYVTRFSNNHIRTRNSWKIVTRLRHVVKSLPKDWSQNHNAQFSAQEWKAPLDAQNTVFEVFFNWRKWEFEKIQDSYVFRDVFGLHHTEEKTDLLDVEVSIRNVALDIGPLQHLLLITDIVFGLNTNKLSNELKEQASTLVDADADDGIDVFMKIGTFTITLKDLKHVIPDIVSLLKEIKAMPQSSEVFSSDTGNLKTVTENAESSAAKLMSFNLLIGEVDCLLGVNKSCLSILSKSTSVTATAVTLGDLLPFVIGVSNESVASKLFVGESCLFEGRLSNNSLNVTNSGSLLHGDKIVDIQLGEGNVIATENSKTMVQMVNPRNQK